MTLWNGTIRYVQPGEEEAWLTLRSALWPHCSLQQHRQEMAEIQETPAQNIVLVAVNLHHDYLGFAEVSIRTQAEGCSTSPVGYLEGWFVAETHRRQHIGAALLHAAQQWAAARGCTEMASDTEIENLPSQKVHKALGFEEVERVVLFRKDLAVLPRRSVRVLALDLEGTLISNAVSQFPRPGLWSFLEFCRSTFARVVIYTAVGKARSLDIMRGLAQRKEAPAWFADLEYIVWEGEHKDLSFVPGADPDEVLLVDDRPAYVLPGQEAQWVPINPFCAPYAEDDRELERLTAVLGALAPAEDDDGGSVGVESEAVVGGVGVGLKERAPDGRAGVDGLLGAQQLDGLVKAGADLLNEGERELVRQARRDVGLVGDGGDSMEPGAHDDGERGEAALGEEDVRALASQ